jgi:hypothetical protein
LFLVDANQLSGTIPALIGFLTNLDHLLLKGNHLSGSLPSELDHLSNLDVLLLDGNSFVGTADVVCKAADLSLQYFVTDCSGSKPEITCSCCTLCCEDQNKTCNAYEWAGNVDPIWEYGYERGRYAFEQGPSIWIFNDEN